MKKKYLLFSLLIANCSFGQLFISTAFSPIVLVQDVLIGPEIGVSNVNFSGSSSAIGYFIAIGTNLGIESGIVMTTGTVLNNGNGPHGPNNAAGSGTDNSAGGCVALSPLIPGGTPTYNAAVLSFDLIAISDTLRFKYVFGSEEYPEFVGSSYSDIFAIFISGPGITGQQNIAKILPSQNVNINTINSGVNSLLYVGNGDGSQSPFNLSENYIQYDGFTSVLEAFSIVQSGQLYHLVFAIADAGDGIIDSGVFVEGKSFEGAIKDKVVHEMSVEIYPNPTSMATTLKIGLPREANVSYCIMNSIGQPIDSDNLGFMKDGAHSIKLNTENYSTGVYFVQVKIGDIIKTQKLIIR